MPIPTRSQSVSKKNETAKPKHQVPSQQGGSATNATEGFIASRTRSAAVQSINADSSSRIAYPRSIPRPTVNSAKPVSTQAPVALSAVSSTRIVRSASTRVPTSAPTAESKKSGHTRVLSNAAEKKPLASSKHVRSASIATNATPTTTSSRGPPTKRSGLTSKTQASLAPTIKSSQDVPETALTGGDSAAADSLRDELFQLMTLYQSSSARLQSFTQSVERDQAERLQLIRIQQEAVAASERSRNQAASLEGLRSWLSQDVNTPNERQLQVLGKAIADLESATSASHGLRLLNNFEDWLSDAMAIREDRVSHLEQEGLKNVMSIGNDWHRQMQDLHYQLATLSTTFADLKTTLDSESGISLTVDRHLQYARVMLSEVEAAISLEKSLVQAETDWETLEIQKVLKEPSTAAASNIPRFGIWTSRSRWIQ